MNENTNATIDAHLDQVTLRQLTWKASSFRNAAIRIVNKALEIGTVEFYPDDVSMGGIKTSLEATTAQMDANCIGTAYRLLMNNGIIKRTGNYRRSKARGRRGATVFGLMLDSTAKAKTFLLRNGVTNPPPEPQKELG